MKDLKVNDQVQHEVYGTGRIVAIACGTASLCDREFDNRYRGALNVFIEWESLVDGGPMGWNEDSNHKISELVVSP